MSNEGSEQVRIFVTHKHEEEDKVMEVINTLQTYGGDRLQFTFAENMPAGTDLREWILENVDAAHLLLFLITEPDQDLTWCVYEAGVFEKANNADTTRRVILMHSKFAEVPKPLAMMKVVQAEQRPVEQFLQQFFGTDELTGKPALNSQFNHNTNLIRATAAKICEHFRDDEPRPEDIKYSNPYIELRFSDPESIKENSLPDDTIVDSNDLRQMFGFADRTCTWGELRKHLASEAQRMGNVNNRWSSELEQALYFWNQLNFIPRVRTVFQTPNGAKYAPILSRIVERDNAKSFRIDFIEQVSAPLASTPDRFASLLSCLMLGNRLEFEVCRRHLEDVELLSADEEAIQGLHEQIGRTIKNIEDEAEFRKKGEMSEIPAIDRLVSALQPNDEADIVEDCLKEQTAIKKKLMDPACPLGADELKKKLELLRELNQRVMVFAAKRYAELIDMDFDIFDRSADTRKAGESGAN